MSANIICAKVYGLTPPAARLGNGGVDKRAACGRKGGRKEETYFFD